MKSLHGQSNVDPSPFNLSSQLIVKTKKPVLLSSVQISITGRYEQELLVVGPTLGIFPKA